MNRRTGFRFLAVLLLLGAMMGVLSTPTQNAAYGAVCCESCTFLWERCLAGKWHSECGGNALCCSQWTDPCFWTCTYC